MLQIIASVMSLAERVDEERVRLRDEQHVGLVDRLPAADARAVEADAVLEDVLVEHLGRDGEVLPQAGEVHEAEVDGLDLALAEEGQDFAGRAGGFASGHELPRSLQADSVVLRERGGEVARPVSL